MSTTWGVEHVPDPVADEVVHRLDVELRGEAPAGRSLMIASSACVAARRLVEQPGVLEGDAQAGRERRQQPDVGLAEGVLAVEVLERDDAVGPSPPTISGTKSTTSAARPGATTGLPSSACQRHDVVD